jgi:hypothetical protein
VNLLLFTLAVPSGLTFFFCGALLTPHRLSCGKDCCLVQ